MLGNDADLTVIHYLIEKGHTIEYALNLSISEKAIYLGAMLASRELDEKRRLI